MLKLCILAAIAACVVAPLPKPKQRVHFQPVPKAVPHEEPVVHGDKVPLLKQHPRIHKQIVTVVDQEPVIIKRPKAIIRENPIRVKYPVDKPIIQHKRIIKPIHKERTVVIKRPIDVPRPIVKTKTIGVPKPYIVHKPFHRVKTVTNVVERVHKIPKAIPKPDLRVIHRDRPFPVENLVIKKKPRVIEVPYDKPVHIVEEITNVVREPVPQPRDKVLNVDHPVLVNRKVPYYPKDAGPVGGPVGGGPIGGGQTVVVAAGGGAGFGAGGGHGGDHGVGRQVVVAGGAGLAGGYGGGETVVVGGGGGGYGPAVGGYGGGAPVMVSGGKGGYGQGVGGAQTIVFNGGAGGKGGAYGQQIHGKK